MCRYDTIRRGSNRRLQHPIDHQWRHVIVVLKKVTRLVFEFQSLNGRRHVLLVIRHDHRIPLGIIIRLPKQQRRSDATLVAPRLFLFFPIVQFPLLGLLLQRQSRCFVRVVDCRSGNDTFFNVYQLSTEKLLKSNMFQFVFFVTTAGNLGRCLIMGCNLTTVFVNFVRALGGEQDGIQNRSCCCRRIPRNLLFDQSLPHVLRLPCPLFVNLHVLELTSTARTGQGTFRFDSIGRFLEDGHQIGIAVGIVIAKDFDSGDFTFQYQRDSYLPIGWNVFRKVLGRVDDGALTPTHVAEGFDLDVN
mmetsp:Transcript_21099/g.32224  ORF Transcript_21099/g.32224 Transcript_21099/m.32224 type:complete len:302 (+) Transcript_21099:584-1489(+)